MYRNVSAYGAGPAMTEQERTGRQDLSQAHDSVCYQASSFPV